LFQVLLIHLLLVPFPSSPFGLPLPQVRTSRIPPPAFTFGLLIGSRLFGSSAQFRMTPCFWSEVTVGLSLGSSALRSAGLSPSFFATTASADFSTVLAAEISPSKALNLSGRAAELYLMGFR
jgi:hypothetical protein